MKNAYKVQAALLKALFAVLSLLPPRLSSRMGGSLISALSPFFIKQNKQIDKHLKLFMQDADHKTIKRKLWRHLGMTLGEYPHLPKAIASHPDFKIDVKGLENLNPPQGKPAMYASAHIGNWEMLPVITRHFGQPFHPVFRPPNNPDVADLLERARSAEGILSRGFPKGMAGLRDITATLKRGENIGMLLDQRHSGGVKIPFFGRDADTTPAAVDLARKFGASLIPGRIIRNGPCDFTLQILPAIPTEDRSSLEVMTELYGVFEQWIREYPEQWLWMHRRWGKEL